MLHVADGYVDYAFWGRHEDITLARLSWSLSPSSPGSDLAAETAEVLAAASMAFRGEVS